jgi:hypothetical protein
LPDGMKGKAAFRSIVFFAKLFSSQTVAPEYIKQDDIISVLNFIRNYPGQLLVVAVTRDIMRLCNLAEKNNLRLSNVIFYWTNEPLTSRRREKMETQGAGIMATYGCREIGHMAFSCPFCSRQQDQYHLSSDIVGLIERQREVAAGLNIRAFLWTGLLLDLPKIMINVENGDYGRIEKINCPCLYGSLGLGTRLSNIRSFEKLLSEEMAFFGERLGALVEEVLPDEFGGNDFDYQFVQEEDGLGKRQLCLYASPALGQINAEVVRGLIYKYLEKDDCGQGIIAAIRKQSEIIPIRRLKPITTPRGKIWSFYKKLNIGEIN